MAPWMKFALWIGGLAAFVFVILPMLIVTMFGVGFLHFANTVATMR